MSGDKDTCCEGFVPEPWDEQEITWSGKRFVKDRIRSFLHIPLNFGSVMRRNAALISAAGAEPEEMIVLTDEDSLWGADVYLEATGDVPGAEMVTLSGTFLSKVFEGPYKNIPGWMREMGEHVASQGKELRKLYCYYATCPRCAKKLGKNYVVLLAQV